jgi:cyclohexa-1,5-dienecarbonyl-CoA hydratase
MAVRLEVRDHVAWLTLDRPPLNILDIAMNREFAAAVRSAASSDARVFALTGAGDVFSAGVQIEDHEPSRVREMLAAFHDVFRAFVEAGKPLVAVVRGPAMGGGCELVAFADAVVASEEATFGFPEITLGCFAPVASIVLPRVVGASRAAELLLTGQTIDALRAEAIGLVNVVAEEAGFAVSAEEFVAGFAQHSGAALALAREALGGRGDFLKELARVEALYLDRLMATHDAPEGIAAWRDKRPPDWQDR